SAIVQYISGKRQPTMPKGAKPLAADQIELVKNWIAQGAVDDTMPTAPVPAAANAPKSIADATKTQATSQPIAAANAAPTSAPTTAASAVATTSPTPT